MQQDSMYGRKNIKMTCMILWRKKSQRGAFCVISEDFCLQIGEAMQNMEDREKRGYVWARFR